ncbi:MAG: type II toxin-antitoxin system YafQ family toxin [Prevotella sp.]|nr:type II toxin-antitoxin system YafQ family toxin [Prevotella sp.]
MSCKYRIVITKRYLRDLKLARKRRFDEDLLNEVVRLLSEGEEIPKRYRNHALHGDYQGYWDLHITPDWLLIYKKDTEIKIISLYRTGTHADLFK